MPRQPRPLQTACWPALLSLFSVTACAPDRHSEAGGSALGEGGLQIRAEEVPDECVLPDPALTWQCMTNGESRLVTSVDDFLAAETRYAAADGVASGVIPQAVAAAVLYFGLVYLDATTVLVIGGVGQPNPAAQNLKLSTSRGSVLTFWWDDPLLRAAAHVILTRSLPDDRATILEAVAAPASTGAQSVFDDPALARERVRESGCEAFAAEAVATDAIRYAARWMGKGWVVNLLACTSGGATIVLPEEIAAPLVGEDIQPLVLRLHDVGAEGPLQWTWYPTWPEGAVTTRQTPPLGSAEMDLIVPLLSLPELGSEADFTINWPVGTVEVGAPGAPATAATRVTLGI